MFKNNGKIEGGGHITDAATQLKNISIEEGKQKILELIKEVK